MDWVLNLGVELNVTMHITHTPELRCSQWIIVATRERIRVSGEIRTSEVESAFQDGLCFEFRGGAERRYVLVPKLAHFGNQILPNMVHFGIPTLVVNQKWHKMHSLLYTVTHIPFLPSLD